MAETLETIKKYIGPFSGPQMDQIFYEILNYTSERYAKGTANGQAVAAGTIGYNDNSYYYSRQSLQYAQAAENAAARAESAVPAGINSAVLWTTDQSSALTDANKAVARKNIRAGGSNPNLLDNPWFTINQRAVTSGANVEAAAYVGPDRWKLFRAANWNISNSAITLSWSGNGNAAGINQYTGPEVGNQIKGKTATLSAYIDGVLYSKTFTIPNAGGSIASTAFGGGFYYVINSDNETTQNRGVEVQFRTNSTSDKTIGPVKLELGTVSTLANDAPPNYAAELAKCQRHFIRIDPVTVASQVIGGFALGASSTLARGVLPLPVAMWTGGTPQIASNGVILQNNNLTTNYAVSAVAIGGITVGAVQLRLTTSGIAQGSIYFLAFTSGGYIDISKEL